MDESIAMAGMIVMAIVLIVGIAICALSIIAWWKIFKKAGEPGWKIFIPIYNSYVQYKIARIPILFWVYLLIGAVYSFAYARTGVDALIQNLILDGTFAPLNVPMVVVSIVAYIAMLVILIIYSVKLAKAFGRSGAFAVGLIFLPLIFQCILAFGKSEYVKIEEPVLDNTEEL